MPYFLHEYQHFKGKKINNGYWELDHYGEIGEEVTVYNEMGGWHDHVIQENDEIVYAEDRRDLDHSFLLDPNSNLGWLAPDGTFYGCAYFAHEDVAYYVLKASSYELEEKGWVKLYESRLFGGGPNYYLGQPNYRLRQNWLTQPQIDWLLLNGYGNKIMPDDVKDYWEGMFDGST